MTKATGYYRANQGFATTLDDEPLFVQKGELVHAKHPLLKGREELFDAATDFGRFDVVEQATAAPGEKRVVARKKAKKPKAAPAPKAAAAVNEPEKFGHHFGLRTSDIGEPQP